MKNRLRVSALLIAAIVSLFSLSAAFAAPAKSFTLTVLSTNDTHGQPAPYAFSGAVTPGGIAWNSPVAGGLAARKTYVDKVRAANPDTIVLDAGDVNTGNILSNLFQAKPDILGMNLVGYNAMTVGNHEFDISQAVMQERRKDAKFPFLSANVYVKATGKRLLDPYAIIALPDCTVGVIGVTTTETPTAVMPANVADLEFRDPVAEVKSLVKEVRAKADFVIVLSHLGLAVDRDLVAAVDGIDLVIGGHSHTYMGEGELMAGVPILQAYSGGVFMGRVDLKVAGGKVVSSMSQTVPINLAVQLKEGQAATGTLKELGGKKYDFVAGYLDPDPSVEAMLKPFVEQLSKDMDTVIAQAAGEFPHAIGGLTNYPRRDDCALANMLCDAMREATSAKVGKPVDVFLQNGGGIRAPIPAGPITKKTVYTVLPFDNTIMTAKITGAQLVKLLETKVLPVAILNYGEKYSGPDGSFLQVSGMTYTLDLAAKTVSDVKVGGQPVDPAKVYLMATQNFMMSGGDGYVLLKDLSDQYSTSVFQRDMAIEWLAKKGSIDPAAYDDNRINLLNTGH
jgi:5'-nucleotidase/UDP-sugar diphosphatase